MSPSSLSSSSGPFSASRACRLLADTDRKARELGVQTVVSGGEYETAEGLRTVQLFVSPAHTWAMDKEFTPLVVMTTAEIKSLRVEPAKEDWVLHVWGGEHKAEFVYRGIFAERFARLAEETLRHATATVKPSVLSRTASV